MGIQSVYGPHFRNRQPAGGDRSISIRACGARDPDRQIAVASPHAQKAFGFVGKRGAGKTTLMAAVAEALCAAGYTVSAVCCSRADDGGSRHGMEARLMRDAGCREVMRPEQEKPAPMHGCCVHPQQQLERMLCHMTQVDIVLVEGFEAPSLPKLEIVRPSPDMPFVAPRCGRIAALATDADIRYSGITLDLNVPQTVADFIITYLGLPDACGRSAAASTPD